VKVHGDSQLVPVVSNDPFWSRFGLDVAVLVAVGVAVVIDVTVDVAVAVGVDVGVALVMRLVGGERIVPHRKSGEILKRERERAYRVSASIRSLLVPEFASVGDADLAIVGVCLVVRKC
jgi:hypothetical protein